MGHWAGVSSQSHHKGVRVAGLLGLDVRRSNIFLNCGTWFVEAQAFRGEEGRVLPVAPMATALVTHELRSLSHYQTV